MTTISPGFTFIDQDLVALCSKANLDQFMTGSTFTNLDREVFSDFQRPIFKGGSAPSNPKVGEVWWIPQANGVAANPGALMLVWDGSTWRAMAEGVILPTQTTALQYGDIVVAPGSLIGERCDLYTGGLRIVEQVIGIAGATIPNGSSGPIITHGLAIPNNFDATPINWASISGSTTTDNSLDGSSATARVGSFGRVLDATNRVCFIHGLIKVV